MKDIKKIIAIICLVLGLAFVGFGGYKIVTFDSSDEEEKKENDKKEEDKKEENLEEVKSEIQTYLKDKYNEDFEVVKLVKTFCLDGVELYGTNCTDNNIKNEIFEVKNSNDLSFYVKKVSYDTTKINLTDEDAINTQSVGLYDNYISFIVANKLARELEPLYSSYLGGNVIVEIFDGLGISNISHSNAYENLGKDMQVFTDKEISLNDFVANLDSMENDLSILIKVDQEITKDNFQSIVTTIKNTSFVPNGYLIEVDDVLIQFNNGNRYIEYSMGGIIRLKYGKDIYDSFNDDLYDKTIILDSNIFSTDGISYDEFMALDPSTFNF
ncbi:MAG: hypothetical protein J6A52_03560 [Bacilli bacterium]|nr:hypothetical protein [Bacilli bacterium]